MHMGVKSPRHLEAGVERFPSVFGKPFYTEFESSVDELHVMSFLEGIIYDCLILVDRD